MTHGHIAPLVRWLQEAGHSARAIATHFEGENAEDEVETERSEA